ncbi:MAG: hypothetical protein PHN31_00330 [Candidatus Gracilibacteria bacterium]|nr:hypothetical protein [Candidatus Gracilibacteria bacterium]
MKKLLSFVLSFCMLFTNFLGVFALTSASVNTNINLNSNLENVFLTDLGNKTFQINYQDVTASNAGKVIKTWKGKTNIPTKFVLEGGFSLNLNETNLDSYLVKTKKFKDDVEKLNKTTGFKSINQEDIELTLLPDRLQITQKTTVKFTGKKLVEPSLLEDVISTKSNGPTEDELKNDKNVKALGISQDFSIPDNADELLINEIVKDCKANSNELPSQLKGNCTYDSVKTRFENIEKTMVTEEKVDISIIPPSFNDVTKKTVLSAVASDARITKNEIISRFETYKKIQQTKNTYTLKYKGKYFTLDQSKFDTFQKTYNQKFQQSKTNSGSVIGGGVSYTENPTAVLGGGVTYQEETPYIYGDISTCDRYSNIQDKNDCKALFSEKENATIVKYNQMLLNGFTLGQADRKHWSKSLYAFDYKVFKARIDVGYSYGFGVRIPMSAEVNLGKNILDDYTEGDKINNSYSFDVKVDTHDFSTQDYKNVGVNQNQTFEGKEFVLELDAYLDAGIYLRGIINKNYHLSLVDTVIRAILTYAGFTKEEIDMIVTPDKGFYRSKDFIPPFAGDDKVALFEPIDGAYPFVDTSYLVLKGGITIEAGIDGAIKMDCENINSSGGCPSSIRFDDKNKKSYTGTALFNENNYSTDKLGAYSNFGPKLDNFQYIPELVFQMLAYGVVKAKVPIIDEWYSYTTPKWELYSFSVDMGSLGTHAGTNGVVDATLNNKVYTAYKNPIPLNENYTNKVEGIETVYVDENDIDTIVDDSYMDISDINNMKGFNKVVYSTDGSTPECSSPNILSYRQNKIWQNSKDVLENTKNIMLKTRACDMFGNKTLVKTNTYQVRNTYFEPMFKIKNEYVQGLKLPLTMGNNTKSYIYYSRGIDSSVDGVELSANSFGNSSSFIVYTLDGSIPTCIVGGPSFKYTGKILRSTLDNYKKDAEKTTSAGLITIKSAQCINLSGKQTFKSNISTLTLDVLSSTIESGINGLEGTNSNLLGQGIGNLLGGNGLNGGVIDGLGDNLGGNAGGPKISTMDMGYNGDGVQRKYANTRMNGCNENDIILGNKVWASCNSDYELNGSLYYSGSNSESTDINGWKFGRLYSNSNIVCPNGYRVPNYFDFSDSINTLDDIRILKLPATGYKYQNKFTSKNTIGSYNVDWLPIQNPPTSFFFYADSYSNEQIHDGQTLINALRCIRSSDATFEEKNGDLSVVGGSLSLTGTLSKTSSGSGLKNFSLSNYVSTDDYVNEKLGEINVCFKNSYLAHLENINNSIDKLKADKSKIKSDVNEIKKYDNAIKKLEEIKKIFINRYNNLFEY